MRAAVVLIALAAGAHHMPALISPHTAIRGHSIDSRTNDNSRFQVRVDTGPLADDVTPSLRYSGGTLTNAGKSWDRTSTSVWFDVDRATAQILSRDWGSPIHERTPLDADLRYTWRFPAEVTRGSPIPIAIVATNAGTHRSGSRSAAASADRATIASTSRSAATASPCRSSRRPTSAA